ncbi:MAG: type II secretion system F family protein [Planctomycetes bacterium]|nr:type II secretion system F family protein [Planctomycetota bacterium]
MPLYAYTAMNESGQIVTGDMEAKVSSEVVSRLRRDGMFAQKVELSSGVLGGGAAKSRRKSIGDILFPGVSQSDVTALTRQLATFLQGGFPLIRALEFIQRNAAKESLAELIGQLADAIRNGNTLTSAISEHPKIFDKLYINMVSAGETSGQLETMFERLATMREGSEELRKEIKGALTYPGFMMLAMGGSLVILMAFVVPKFAVMFEDMGAALPAPTMILMQISSIFENYWWLILGALVGGYFGFKQYSKTDEGRLNVDATLLKMPIVGDLCLKSATARFSQTLSTLLDSGVDLVSSLACVQNVTGNEVIAKAIGESLDEVKQGNPLSDTLQVTNALPDELIEMIRVGEESGQVGSMLERAAITYNRDVRNVVKSFTKILEPLMILIMGVVIGFIVVAMLLPVFEMSTGG